MSELETIVRNLIASRKEGDYWDFKATHHDKAGDLIKDVVCLANTPRHKGDRYLIFGVADDCGVPGLGPDALKEQANIINTLANAGFAANNYPDVYLRDLTLDGKQIQVLIIKDLPEKPYYLQDGYNKLGVRLNPGTIYSRVRDTNTPTDHVASASDIEAMWREQFGLDRSPLERMRNYLLNFDGWTEITETSWYYTVFPEFTVSATDEETWEVLGGVNWVRAATNPKAFVRPMRLSYHQTVLATVTCIYFDEMRQLASAPKMYHHPTSPELWFFGIEVGTLEFLLLQFLTRSKADEFLEHGFGGSRGSVVPVAVFRSPEERLRFLEELRSNPISVKDKHQFSIGRSDTVISDKDREIIAYSRAVLERLEEWRARGADE